MFAVPMALSVCQDSVMAPCEKQFQPAMESAMESGNADEVCR